ncbi:Uncharacterised protein [Bordetella pertussis]|nr:Uncharacterised protein [Bordetella pertussis]CFO68348.1 Uncharacterised protein [Bordetella pertussis]CFT87132.1 Uncharacterised protein [Bordetella pertussis]CFU81136.1 Uncharacterised protein [Bordetella pertussis]CFW37782.1 Uncharacterised protein [Bordetella pertussis]
MVRATLGRRSGPMTTSAMTPITISSVKLTSNMRLPLVRTGTIGKDRRRHGPVPGRD